MTSLAQIRQHQVALVTNTVRLQHRSNRKTFLLIMNFIRVVFRSFVSFLKQNFQITNNQTRNLVNDSKGHLNVYPI